MAEPSTIARPYAEAAFRIAVEAGQLPAWSSMLHNLAQVSVDERVRGVIANPELSAAQVAGAVIGILSGRLSGDAENFVRVLADNRRLGLLAEIRAQFEARKDAHEGAVEAEIRTAFALDDAQLTDLVARLEAHTRRKVRPRVLEDKELIGGVKVIIGDKVIDASARAQLEQFARALKN